MTLLDGRKASTEIRENIRKEVESLNSKPHLVIIMIGENPASKIYVNKKLKACQKAGFNVTLNKLGVEITERELLDLIQKYNSDDDVDGMIVQLPVPEHISKNKIIKSIDPSKDVDGFHPDNMGKTTLDIEGLQPATPLGIVKLLEFYEIDWTGMDVVVIGRSNHVGLPISIMMGNHERGTVTSCHINTKNLKQKTLNADLIIVAVGKPNLLTEDMVKDDVIIVDVGINRLEDGKIVGDVDFDNIKIKSRAISPVPGGVGPMTITSLMLNTLYVHKDKFNLN